MTMDRVGNRHAFPANILFETYGSPWRRSTPSPVLYTFWSPARFYFLASNRPWPNFVAIRIGETKIGIRRAILCTAGPDAFGCFLGFFTKLRCEYELGGFTLVLWWHWVVQEGWL